jgi:hypothetical protein
VVALDCEWAPPWFRGGDPERVAVLQLATASASLVLSPICTMLMSQHQLHRTVSRIPTVNGNTVRSFSTHGQQSAAKGSLNTVSRSDFRLIQHLDSSALGLVRRWRLIGYFPIHVNPQILSSDIVTELRSQLADMARPPQLTFLCD